jgi:hypothetical protein
MARDRSKNAACKIDLKAWKPSSSLALSFNTSAAMTKPTILQTLLGRPSQKYSFPREKEYHSAKRDLLRYVAEQPIDNDNAGHREEPVESNREVSSVGKALSLERDFHVRHPVIRID